MFNFVDNCVDLIVELCSVLSPRELAEALVGCCLGQYAAEIASSLLDSAAAAAPGKVADIATIDVPVVPSAAAIIAMSDRQVQ